MKFNWLTFFDGDDILLVLVLWVAVVVVVVVVGIMAREKKGSKRK